MKPRYVVDSSVWIEVFGKRPLAAACLRELSAAQDIAVPTVVLFEVYKKIAVAHSEDQALSAVATMRQYSVADLTQEIALSAADIAIKHKLAMADSVVLAHALQGGQLLTLDNDFAGIAGAKVLRPNSS